MVSLAAKCAVTGHYHKPWSMACQLWLFAHIYLVVLSAAYNIMCVCAGYGFLHQVCAQLTAQLTCVTTNSYCFMTIHLISTVQLTAKFTITLIFYCVPQLKLVYVLKIRGKLNLENYSYVATYVA